MDATRVAQHSSKEDCWVIIHGKAWDVTEFLSEHPGGAKVIFQHAGKDATQDYDAIHGAELVEKTLSPSMCKGTVDMSTVVSSTIKPVNTDMRFKAPPLGAIVNVDDFEKVAERHLSPTGWAYYSSGAEDEISMQEARQVFRSLYLRPRILRDVRAVSAARNILGCPSSLPIYISPTGSAKYAHPDGEKLIARAAGKEGLIYCMPTSPSATWEDIFAARTAAEQPLFCQLYLNQDINKAKDLIRKANRLGARAIFVTVDSPVIGKRERDERLVVGDDPFIPTGGGVAKTGSAGLLNAGLTWRDLTWIKQTSSVPVVIKGVQSVEDAVLAYQHGVDGIVLSNHGGRSQDTAQAPMTTLLEIRRFAPWLLSVKEGKRFEVFVDGGIRRGTDVLKALALGATAVGIGRPVLYAMTAGYGENGIRRMVQILRAELETNMALVGTTTCEELIPEMVNSERAERDVTSRAKL